MLKLKKSHFHTLVLSSAALIASPAAHAGGLLGDVVRGIGHAVGSPDLVKVADEGDNAMRDIKEHAPLAATVITMVSAPAGVGTLISAKENPKETLIVGAVAVSLAIGCADGCSIGLSGLASAGGGTAVVTLAEGNKGAPGSSGLATPIPPEVPSSIAAESGRAEPGLRSPAEQSAAASDSTPFAAGHVVQTARVFPQAYSKRANPRGAPFRTEYRTEKEVLYRTLNTFYEPPQPLRRTGQIGDSAGGEFSSRRKRHIVSWGAATYGADARRVHAANDRLTGPMQSRVPVPMTGVIRGYNSRGLGAIVIDAPDGTRSQVLYAKLSPAFNERYSAARRGEPIRVKAGDLGVIEAQDTRPWYPAEPQHVHIDFFDPFGKRFNPWGNEEQYQGAIGQDRLFVPPPR